MRFIKDKSAGILILNYSSDDPLNWLMDKFENNEGHTFSNTFHLTKNDLIENFNVNFINENQEEGSLDFQFGVLDEKGEYYKVQKSILDIKNDLYIHKKFKLERKIFVAYMNISIFRYIDEIIDEPIYLGGQNPNAISQEGFMEILKSFPNSTECSYYRKSRVSLILSQYYENRKNVIAKYENYMNKKKSIRGKNLLENFREYEKDKYKTIKKKMEKMLDNEKQYNEKQWQIEIIEILRLIFPKYIKVFREAEIEDFFKNTRRRPDFLLIDSEGYVDIVEIKKPPLNPIWAKPYRDNYYHSRELSGTVMQVEKYVLHLNRSGQTGENRLNKKYETKLPQNLKIKIINPGAMIIFGRNNNLSSDQKVDFEIIRRQYKNIIDIITYDDLIRRLNNIISQFEEKD